MTGGKLEIAYGFILVAAACVLMTLCGLIAGKAFRALAEYRRKESARKLQPYFERLLARLVRTGALPKPEGRLSRTDREIILLKLTAWIERLSGPAREKLTALCEELGFVDRELARLRSRRSLVRTRAAHRLGLIRSKRAAAPLLEELRRERFGPALFVLARSLALCARGADDLEAMVMQVIKHRKRTYEMTAAILEEADGDKREICGRLMQSGIPDAVRIALICEGRFAEKPDKRSAGNVLSFREPAVRSGARKSAGGIGGGRAAK